MKTYRFITYAVLLASLVFLAFPAAMPAQALSSGTYNMGSVTCGQSISTVTITTGGDQYSFYGTSGQYVTIDAAGSNGYDTVLELYNSGGTRVASDDDSGSGLSARITTTLGSTGTYTIIARGYGGRTGSYTLTVTCSGSSGSTGSTGSSGTSGTYNMGSISCGQSRSTNTITTGGDQYSFYGTSGQYVTIDAVGVSGYDTYLELYNSSGSRIAYNDDGGSGLNARIQTTLPSTGNYTIIARGYSGRTGSYTISVTCGGSSGSTGSTGSSGAFNMGSISCGQTVSTHTIYSAGDQYSFYGTSGQYVSIAMNGVNGYDTYLELYNSSGTRIAYNDDGGSGLNSLLSTTLPSSGNYTIIARGLGGALGYYSITVTCGGSSGSTGSTGTSGTYNMGSISCGQSRSTNTITTGGDQYSFYGTSGQYVTIDAAGNNGYDTVLELFNSSGTRIASDDDSGSGLSARITTTLPSSGNYTIVARGYAGRLGTYTITVTCTNSGQQGGQTGTFNMGSISCGQSVSTHTIYSGGDQYSFYGTAGQYISIAMNGVSNYDTYLELYNSSGTRIAYDDDGGSGLSSLLQTTLPSTGTYTIIARGLGGGLGSYTITITCGSSNNNTNPTGGLCSGYYGAPFNMGNITYGQTVSSFTIRQAGDGYLFYGSSGDSITITMTGQNGYDTYLELYGPNCQQIATNDDGAGYPNARIQTTLNQTGNYTIIARGYSGRTGSYSLLLQRGSSGGTTTGGTTGPSGTYNMGSISCGQSRSSVTISAAGDSYTFYGTANQYITVDAIGSNNYDTYLEIYNSSGSRIGYDDDSGTGLNAQLYGSLPNTGNYTIVVRGYSGRTGSYTLNMQCGSTGTTGSTGSTGGTCQSSYGTPYNMGSISYGQTVSTVTIRQGGDSYTFSGSAGDTVTIAMNGVNGYDTYLHLFGPGCSEIATNDDGGPGLSSLLQTTLPSSGTYTIVARGFGGRTGSYSITLTRGGSSGSSGSTGSSGGLCSGSYGAPYNMGSLTYGQTVSTFTIRQAGDGYTFYGNAGDYITIVAYGQNNYDTVLELYNSSCSQLASNDDGAGYPNPRIQTSLPSSGYYTIIVRGYGGRTGSYSVTLSR